MTITTCQSGRADRTQLAVAAALFHGLADPTRLAILRQLSGGEARVADLTARFGLAQSTISAHVACLRECGLVVGRPAGRQVFYSLARPELIDLLASAEDLLADVGTQVSLCPTYGPRPQPEESDVTKEPND